MQSRIIRSLAIIGEHLVSENRWDLLSKTVESILNWFRNAEEGDFTFEKVAGILHAFMEQAWKRGNIAAGDRILEVFYQIRAGIVKKPPPVQALVGWVQGHCPAPRTPRGAPPRRAAARPRGRSWRIGSSLGASLLHRGVIAPEDGEQPLDLPVVFGGLAVLDRRRKLE